MHAGAASQPQAHMHQAAASKDNQKAQPFQLWYPACPLALDKPRRTATCVGLMPPTVKVGVIGAYCNEIVRTHDM